MLKEYTVKSVTSNNKKKDGTPLVGKFGPYWIIRIDTEEEGTVSMFGKQASTLKAGDKITGTVEVKEANGFTNKNFTPAKPTDELQDRVLKLEKRVTSLEMSFERKFAEFKHDLVLQMTGKVQTDSDHQEMKKRDTERNRQLGVLPDEGIPLYAYGDDPDIF